MSRRKHLEQDKIHGLRPYALYLTVYSELLKHPPTLGLFVIFPSKQKIESSKSNFSCDGTFYFEEFLSSIYAYYTFLFDLFFYGSPSSLQHFVHFVLHDLAQAIAGPRFQLLVHMEVHSVMLAVLFGNYDRFLDYFVF